MLRSLLSHSSLLLIYMLLLIFDFCLRTFQHSLVMCTLDTVSRMSSIQHTVPLILFRIKSSFSSLLNPINSLLRLLITSKAGRKLSRSGDNDCIQHLLQQCLLKHDICLLKQHLLQQYFLPSSNVSCLCLVVIGRLNVKRLCVEGSSVSESTLMRVLFALLPSAPVSVLVLALVSVLVPVSVLFQKTN